MNTHIIGTKGEEVAKQFLIAQKYQILQTNYKNMIGEIDIVAKDIDTIVFVEVKARNTARFGLPREAITPQKQYKIRQVATAYLKHNKLMNAKVRFDCIDILGDQITHIKNCF